ncbi:U32 family peptidase [Treponema parvum]|uniref:U32 family peptidase n=1 Tax=Treponema parvum TaxID=138851 RepID=A0A975F2D2_9SPIR|nr:U32 family peptidase [Treponema parvum]QTQ13128.1 U32 family peptidase [Treponema parvum]
MELLSPAGNVKKLYYAYAYGADAAYIGLKKFSLRVKADNFYEDEYKRVIELKKQFPDKKLHCALNISFHDSDIEQFMRDMDYFHLYPIDAFIIQDIGILPVLQKHFPEAKLHLSTQASCVNGSAVKMYKNMGFSRIVLGREASLDDIRKIKDFVPDMELEAFCHGAMCIAYSGRCLMSAYLTGRSAQAGFCSHTCRWNFDVMTTKKADQDKQASGKKNLSAEQAKLIAESGTLLLREHERPDEYFPVFEGENFTAVLSSKDLCMIEHLDDMKKSGLDSIKIEGRMKSIYYVALVTRAYRKALDALEGKISKVQAAPFIAELENVSHRESTTGFFYDRTEADKTAYGASDSPYELGAIVEEKLTDDFEREFFKISGTAAKEVKTKKTSCGEKDITSGQKSMKKKSGWKFYRLEALNKFDPSMDLEVITPETVSLILKSGSWKIADPETGLERTWVCNGHKCVLYAPDDIPTGALIRIKDSGYVSGKIRVT